MQRMAGTPEEQEEFRRGLEERAREADKKANEMRDEMEALMRRNGAEDGVKLLPPRISISESTDER